MLSQAGSQMFRSLKHRDFRTYFFGQIVSGTGTWMQLLGINWMAYVLTHSAWMVGLVAFATAAPIFFFAPIAGVIVDRFDRRKLVMLIQLLGMIQALIL